MHNDQKITFSTQDISKAIAHIELKWYDLTLNQSNDDGTLVGLPQPYIVPSVIPTEGFVFKEMYYWDSYFMAKGLRQSGHSQIDEGMLENLIYLMKKFHIIPNANRFYMTSRSQPPVLTSYIFEIFETYDKSTAWLKERMNVAEREYENVWCATSHPNHRKVYQDLSRYYDVNVLDDLAECESGWDMTTRFDGKCLSFIPIDLNCLLHKYELDFARYCQIIGDADKADVWLAKAAYRQKNINDVLWNEEKGFYFDYNFVEGYHSEVYSLAAYYALSCKVASHSQAQKLIENIDKFNFAGGLSTTSSLVETDPRLFGKQWSYPNGWSPLQWWVTDGLKKYGYNDLAEEIARKWLKTNLDYFLSNGEFKECYNVVNPLEKSKKGVYPHQVGFGWTNAIFLQLAYEFLSPQELAKV